MSTHYDVIMIGTGHLHYVHGTGHLHYVHGTRGKDLTEPKASVAYKYMALTQEPRIQEQHNDWQRCGYKPLSPGRRDAKKEQQE